MSLDVGASYRIRASVEGQAQLDKFNQTLKQTGSTGEASAGQIRNAMRMLPAQFTDIGTQLAGGQNPFLILLQQGGQIRDQFGSVGAALRGIGSVLTPVRLGFMGLAGAVAAFGVAAFQGYKESQQLQRSIALTGNYAGMTASQFDAAAARIQKASGATAGAARELLMGAVGSGNFGPAAIEATTSAMARLQKISGQSAEDVIKVFAGMSKGASAWAAETNKAYNFLTVEQFKYLQQLEAQGRQEQAMAEAARMLDQALANRTVQLGLLERAWGGVKSAASTAWNAMMNIGRDDTTADKIDALGKQLETFKARTNGGTGSFGGRDNAKIVADLEAQIAALQEVERLERRSAMATAERAAEQQKLIEKAAEEEKQRKQAQSDFDRMIKSYQDQIARVGELGAAEEFLRMVQLGRYDQFTKAQQDQILALARELDYRKMLEETEKTLADRRREAAREREQAAAKEAQQLDAARQKWIDVIDPVEKYRRELEEIRKLVAAGKLTPDQGIDAEFKVQEKIQDLQTVKKQGVDTFSTLEAAIRRFGDQTTDTFLDLVFTGKASFGDLAASMLRDLARMLIQVKIMQPIFDSLKSGGAGGGWAAALGGLFSFDGGGYTGSKPRAGGLDGKGGFLAMLHPQETVVDNYRGQGMGGVVVNVAVSASGQQMQTSGGNEEAGRLGAAIGAAVRAEIIQQQRPGGLLAAA